jgi:hypothetical protein
MRPPFLVLVASAVLLGCERPASRNPRLTVYHALHGVLVYPRSEMVRMEAGDSAGQITLASPDSVALVAAWFRDAFRLNGWELQSDARSRDGVLTLYAQKGNRPVWVTFQPSAGGPGTTYTVIGAIVSGDTVK